MIAPLSHEEAVAELRPLAERWPDTLMLVASQGRLVAYPAGRYDPDQLFTELAVDIDGIPADGGDRTWIDPASAIGMVAVVSGTGARLGVVAAADEGGVVAESDEYGDTTTARWEGIELRNGSERFRVKPVLPPFARSTVYRFSLAAAKGASARQTERYGVTHEVQQRRHGRWRIVGHTMASDPEVFIDGPAP